MISIESEESLKSLAFPGTPMVGGLSLPFLHTPDKRLPSPFVDFFDGELFADLLSFFGIGSDGARVGGGGTLNKEKSSTVLSSSSSMSMGVVLNVFDFGARDASDFGGRDDFLSTRRRSKQQQLKTTINANGTNWMLVWNWVIPSLHEFVFLQPISASWISSPTFPLVSALMVVVEALLRRCPKTFPV